MYVQYGFGWCGAEQLITWVDWCTAPCVRQACIDGYAHQGPGSLCFRCPSGNDIDSGTQRLVGPGMAALALLLLTVWLLRPLFTTKEEKAKAKVKGKFAFVAAYGAAAAATLHGKARRADIHTFAANSDSLAIDTLQSRGTSALGPAPSLRVDLSGPSTSTAGDAPGAPPLNPENLTPLNYENHENLTVYRQYLKILVGFCQVRSCRLRAPGRGLGSAGFLNTESS
eukprot:1187163-Prorocentrum_minimum.AAC.1